jgi:hypothetical protein
LPQRRATFLPRSIEVFSRVVSGLSFLHAAMPRDSTAMLALHLH